jgi:methyltransferase
MVDTRWLYTGLIALVGLERIFELGVARRNLRWLKSRGAVEVGAEHYPVMVAMHGLFLVSCVTEVWLLHRQLHPTLAISMLGLLIVSMLGRYWVMATLGRRWTTRVLCLPGEPTITTGPFRLFRHPNYAAVALEIFALPMVHTAWLTAILFSIANALLLEKRIRVEEEALRFYNKPGEVSR